MVVFMKLCLWCVYDKNMQTPCLCVNALLRSPSLGSKGSNSQMLSDGVGGAGGQIHFLEIRAPNSIYFNI